LPVAKVIVVVYGFLLEYYKCPDQKCGLQFVVSIEEEQELYFMEEPA
jgi:hypothetical protein